MTPDHDEAVHEIERRARRVSFFYGWVERNGERVRVDVLPPEHLWRGDIKLKGQKPDPKAGVLYLDGEEFARVERREDVPLDWPLTARGQGHRCGCWRACARCCAVNNSDAAAEIAIEYWRAGGSRFGRW